MPTAVIDGITTHYEVVGSGPPVLMFAPGGFDATLEKWTTLGAYARTKPLAHLSGTWASVIRRDRVFAESYARQNADDYTLIVAGMARALLDRDTAPGAEPEDLLRLDIPALIVPGQDASHATSAARYLEECLPRAEYWDVPVTAQTEASASTRLLRFLEAVASS